MKATAIVVLCAAVLAAHLPAQVNDGDLVIGQFRDPTVPNSYGPGSIVSLDPTTGKVYTIAPSFTMAGTLAMGPNWIEMASDNTNFMVASLPQGTSPTTNGKGVYFHSVSSAGHILKTLVADPNPTNSLDYINAFDLDYDGTWILAGGYTVWAFDELTLAYSTLYAVPSATGQINALAVDRAPAGPEYVLALFNASTSANPFLVGANRSGIVSTIAAGNGGPAYVSSIEVDRMTGDYITTGFGTNAAGGGAEYMRTTKQGVLQTLNFPATVTSMYRANGIYIDKQNLAYILTYDWQTQPIPTLADNYVCSIYKMDLQGVFITQYIYSSTLLRQFWAAAGITEYGSRHVLCQGSGQPGTKMTVRFSSRKPSDAGRPYQLAASFAYTSGLRMPNGEYLDLMMDDLFLLTARNQAPHIFQGFTGMLDAAGNASAAVVLPASLPPKLGIPIFVSGVVIDPKAPGGIATVGNTHGFVLN
ncbi:MAG: hypothetical protein JXQ29_13715 [Planctomycetes bacterium]|nr:hypothetical protein [Planctomycetota bacterium]